MDGIAAPQTVSVGSIGRGAEDISAVLARNIRVHRNARSMNQTQLAERMREVGYDWTQRVVSSVESGHRDVSVNELLGLALAFGIPPLDLLALAGPAGVVDLSHGKETISFEWAKEWLAGRANIALTDEGLSYWRRDQ